MWSRLEDVPADVLKRYDEGDYQFSPPAVCTVLWNKLAWVNYIFGRK